MNSMLYCKKKTWHFKAIPITKKALGWTYQPLENSKSVSPVVHRHKIWMIIFWKSGKGNDTIEGVRYIFKSTKSRQNLPPFSPPWLPKNNKTRYSSEFQLFSGGELGIRTPGPVTVNSFQDCRNRPLCQLSGCKIIVLNFIYQK